MRVVQLITGNTVSGAISGKIDFQQTEPEGNLNLTVSNVVGLKDGNHGFHIHNNGDCKDPGPHFNPEGVSRHIFIQQVLSLSNKQILFSILCIWIDIH